MSNMLYDYCCVCISKNTELINVSTSDANQIPWSSKLNKCVPEVDWCNDWSICLKCIEHLEISYTFHNHCLQTYEVHKQHILTVKTESIEIPELACLKEHEIQRAVSQVNWDTPKMNVEEIKTEECNSNDDEAMNSSDDEVSCPASESTSPQEDNPLDTLRIKSKHEYQRVYADFYQWLKKNNTNPKSISENVLLAYFSQLSEVLKSSTLWSKYSMLKATLMVNENVDIQQFKELFSFLKRISHGYKAKQFKTFTKQDFIEFLMNAPDEIYLLKKVFLIIGIAGACRIQELAYLDRHNIQDMGSLLRITVKTTRKTKIQRSFTVKNSRESNFPNVLDICRNYIKLRPLETNHKRFFIHYQHGKCTPQPLGINAIAKIPKQIAEYLNLPESSRYTGHSLRKTSAAILEEIIFE